MRPMRHGQWAFLGLWSVFGAVVVPLAHGQATGELPPPAQPAPAQPAPAQPAPAQPPGAPAPAAAAEARATPSAGEPAAEASPRGQGEVDPQGALDLMAALQTGGEPMSAEQAAALAVSSSHQVASAEAARVRAAEAAREAQVAVWPRLDLEARYTRLSATRSGFDFTATTTNPATGMPVTMRTSVTTDPPLLDQYRVQANLSYPVSQLFLEILPRYEASQRAAEAQALRAHAQALNIALSAREAYYNYARARAALLIAQAGLQQVQAQRRDVASLVSAGALARVELMRADAQVASAKVAVARAGGAVAVARTALRTLVHRPGGDIAITEDLTQPPPPLEEELDTLIKAALENRSELRALVTMSDVHRKLASAAAAGQWPKLAVGGSVELGNPNSRSSPYDREWNGSWLAFASLTWSPNDFFSSDASAGQARADLATTLADLAALEDALRGELQSAYEDYQAASTAMQAALVGISAAEESYRVRREQFRAGAAVSTDVIDAETDLRRARLELINAAIDVRVARARLERAVERPQASGATLDTDRQGN